VRDSIPGIQAVERKTFCCNYVSTGCLFDGASVLARVI
jgi:hypothetical protein